MGRIAQILPAGSRITDYISLGVVAKTFPISRVRAILEETGKASIRERDLPAHVMMYYVIAQALYMQSSGREVLNCMLEGFKWLGDAGISIKVAGKSAISQARARLGSEPVRQLHDDVVRPIAGPATRGAWYRGWRLVSLDGSTLDVPNSAANEEAFGRPGSSRGESAFPQIRFVSLLENGTHVLFGTHMAGCTTSEIALAVEVLKMLQPGMLCLSDRNFFSYKFWRQAQETGADLLWRIKRDTKLPCEELLPDGSYLSHTYPSDRDRRQETNGIQARVIEYSLGAANTEPMYRLVTTVLDHEKAPAEELAALYHERWEIETTLDELKTHLRGADVVLRSQTPELVKQEFYGFLMAHFAVRGLMHEAALKIDDDPDTLSFTHTVRVVRRKLSHRRAFSPSDHECPARSCP
jgi:Insertion element 4 transposase N-terminal/Transposase DDE domain